MGWMSTAYNTVSGACSMAGSALSQGTSLLHGFSSNNKHDGYANNIIGAAIAGAGGYASAWLLGGVSGAAAGGLVGSFMGSPLTGAYVGYQIGSNWMVPYVCAAMAAGGGYMIADTVSWVTGLDAENLFTKPKKPDNEEQNLPPFLAMA